MEINKSNIYKEPVSSLEKIPWCFLRNLFKINAECRDSAQLLDDDDDDVTDQDTEDDSAEDNGVNPLDLIAALFLCADSFLQQEMALKMSMCQFSLPLLLPQAKGSQCRLMLWALRDIVKEWRSPDVSETGGFVEDNIVRANMPLFSFVRLRNCSLSKSQTLNNILNSGQNNSNMFVHRDMKGGEHDRTISSGLVEVCWYLPCGTEELNIFSQPVAFANLRGDISESLTQFTFLYQISNATFVFLDRVEEDELRILTELQEKKTRLFLVVNRHNARQNTECLKKTLEELDLPPTSVKYKGSKVNAAGLSEMLQKAIRKCLANSKTTTNIESMAGLAAEFGLSVETNSDVPRKAVLEIIEGIGVHSVPEYKKQQLPLQSDKWKKLAKLEMEECRLKEAGDKKLEDYKAQRQAEIQKIRKELCSLKQSNAMKTFINHVSDGDKEKRDFFMRCMKLELNTRSHNNQMLLRKKLKEKSKQKDVKKGEITELELALVESSLGVEHYMREMGLIYEFSTQTKQSDGDTSRLPGLAAEMLLDGYPLEILDGDASNIPVRWMTDVLTELHRKVGERSRLLVLTVLGVQSSGKSTLLNTMFGVQFPVSSGRCTRGAYMLLLKVGEEMRSQLNYDFLMLIDTEGLKSPHLAMLEDSYEHDNQLATFVIGLSDVTIINVMMENSTEMKDVLQIAIHAFLRMNGIGKKPICHFVHQNVGGVAAHAKTSEDRKILLEQLNEMTQVAARMEKQPAIKAFTDVLEYNVEKNNWYIPGLWNGTPPMAPVNTGYSEAVANFKTKLLHTVKRDNFSQIPEFLQWMKDLWKAVKYENFIFSFRNTLEADMYNNLDKEFSQWEWQFRKEMMSWKATAEFEISKGDNRSGPDDVSKLVRSKKSELLQKTAEQTEIMEDKLKKYYERKDRHVNLIEKYKTGFFNRITCLAKEIQHSVENELDCALELRKSRKEVENIQGQQREKFEDEVKKLINDCKQKGHTLTDEDLEREFGKLWTHLTANVSGLKEQDISGSILQLLGKNFLNRKVYEKLQEIGDLKEMGQGPFKVKTSIIKKMKNFFSSRDSERELRRLADTVIESCTRFIRDTVKTKEDYNDLYIRELLGKVDETLEKSSKRWDTTFEVDLKLHICGIASREFLNLHRKFLRENDPRVQLEELKPQYLSDFIDSYRDRNNCQRKATAFVTKCIEPAVREYISRLLGIQIVEEMDSQSAQYTSRFYFQYNIQEEMLQKGNFQSFVKYIKNYEIYVKDWIFQKILTKMSDDKTLCKLKTKSLKTIMTKITKAIQKASKGADGKMLPDDKESISKLINNMREYLKKDISISEGAEKTSLFQLQSTIKPFTESLMKSLGETEKKLEKEFSTSENITETLNKLPTKPQDELFKQLFGCGRQCPFCKVPCEAGGKGHTEHHATVHRPKGLGGCRNEESEKLVETLCTTSVHSEHRFRNTDTDWAWHPYNDYKTFYPDWLIPPDRTIEASDYWKYILVKYNDSFAAEYEAKPADVPDAWKSITKKQALKGLKEAFNMK